MQKHYDRKSTYYVEKDGKQEKFDLVMYEADNQMLIQQSHEHGYEAGHQRGFADGHKQGYEAGRTSGVIEGRERTINILTACINHMLKRLFPGSWSEVTALLARLKKEEIEDEINILSNLLFNLTLARDDSEVSTRVKRVIETSASELGLTHLE